ncbi:ATP-dependent helicase [Gryllotalpicola protaetiae]|uniref:ATP-dependent helicase n=1 Tax=Gryllotalpicola protaetiae TaxID=2419771 RepID=UPI0013C4F311|nr:ATP-dependent DNA helicase [Gryllotalpicola protaetiae]
MQLDASQQAVLDLPLGQSAVVLGAPGTGKTSTVVELIAARVASGAIGPDEVLALCSSRTAATALRDRLSLRLGVATQGPRARTANSLAFSVVGEHAAGVGAPEPRLLTGAEQDQLLAEQLAGDVDDETIAWPEHLSADVRRLAGFRAELRELMERMVENRISAARLVELGCERGLAEWVAAGEFIARYQDTLDTLRPGFVTAAELLADAARLVASGEVSPGVRLLVVDDLQEFTRAGLDFLAALARRGVPVVAFGDPDVATTTFRGADPAAVAGFGARVGGGAPTLTLSTAHRQPAALREVTKRVTERVGTALAGAQRRAASVTDRVGLVQSIVAPSDAEQYATLARRLRELHLLDPRTPWSRMAVIVRSGRQVPELARALAVAEVPTRTTAAAGALRDDYAAKQLLTAVAVVLGITALDGAVATELLLGPLGGLDVVQLRKLRLALRHEELAGDGSRPGDALLAEALADPGALVTIEDMAPGRAARKLAQTLQTARGQARRGATIEELLWTLWDRSGLAATWSKQAARGGVVGGEANRDLDGVVALFAAAKRFVERSPGRPPGDFVTELLEAAVPEDTLAPRSLADAVLVCTPPAAVGLEFEVVAIAAVQEGTWPNVRLRGSLLHPQALGGAADSDVLDERTAVLHDELRMFALAVSRASSLVIVTASEGDDQQASPFLRLAEGEQVPIAGHPFTLRGLVGQLRRRLASVPADAAAAASLATLAEAGVAGADPAEWYGVLDPSVDGPLVDLDADLEATVAVSPSRMASFEQSPLKWFVDVMSGSSGGLATGVGTIMHAIMEVVAAEPEGDISVDRIWGDVERRWGELNLEPGWVERREKRRVQKMAQGLHDYLDEFEHSGATLLEAEGTFSLRLGQTVINGAIDRVERRPDGTVVIVDLKTGRQYPSGPEVPAHPQLGAYQLAYHDGALRDEGPLGGAKLVFIAPETTTTKKTFREIPQRAKTEAEFDEFRVRVHEAGRGMAGAEFIGVRSDNGRDGYDYRIHLVPEVSEADE